MLFSFTNEHVSSQNVSSSSCVRIRMNENEALHIIDVPTCFCRTCFNRAATAIQSSVKTHPPLALLRCSFGSIPCVAPWPCCHLTPIPVIWKKKKKYIKQVGSAVPVLQTTLERYGWKKKPICLYSSRNRHYTHTLLTALSLNMYRLPCAACDG